MNTSTASTDGLMTTIAQNVSDFSQARRGRRLGATRELRATRPPPVADRSPASGKPCYLSGRNQTRLGVRDDAVDRKAVQDVDEVGDKALLGREPVHRARHDDVALEVCDGRALIRIVPWPLTAVDAGRDRALQRIKGVLASQRAADL